MAAIREQLALRKIDVVASAFVGADWENDAAIIEALPDVDLIVVNGEGTLHHGAAAGRRLLRVIEHPLRRHVPVVFINMLWQDNPPEWDALLKRADLVSVRDTHSQRGLALKDIRSNFCPDFSFSHTWPEALPSQRGNCVAYGDSIYPEVTKELRKAYELCAGPKIYLPIRSRKRHESIHRNLTIGQRVDNIRHKVRGVARSIADPGYLTVEDTDQYLSLLSNARFHITGRYHAACLSVVAGVPFATLASNSIKIEALIDDIGLDRRRLIKSASAEIEAGIREFSEQEISNIEKWRVTAMQKTADLFNDIQRCLLEKRKTQGC